MKSRKLTPVPEIASLISAVRKNTSSLLSTYKTQPCRNWGSLRFRVSLIKWDACREIDSLTRWRAGACRSSDTSQGGGVALQPALQPFQFPGFPLAWQLLVCGASNQLWMAWGGCRLSICHHCLLPTHTQERQHLCFCATLIMAGISVGFLCFIPPSPFPPHLMFCYRIALQKRSVPFSLRLWLTAPGSRCAGFA